MSDDIFNMVKEISRMQMNAMKSSDSGWVKMAMPAKYANRGIQDFSRMLYLDHEPTRAYIDTLFTSAPLHNSKTSHVSHDEVSGLWVLTLSACLDSSD
jgi:hypothetical protein